MLVRTRRDGNSECHQEVESRERLEHDIVGAVTVAPVVEQSTFDQRSQERNPEKYRKGSAPSLLWPTMDHRQLPGQTDLPRYSAVAQFLPGSRTDVPFRYCNLAIAA
jgi:hypothetical protein